MSCKPSNASRKRKENKVRQMLLKFNLLLLLTRIGRERRRMEEVGSLREAIIPRGIRVQTTRKSSRK